MKNVMLLLLFMPMIALAEPSYGLSVEDAERVRHYLEENPFILDYCDCCQYEGKYANDVFLLKVISSEIVSSKWYETKYDVKVEVEIIAEIPYTSKGLDILHPKLSYSPQKLEFVSMNYTWVYSKEERKAVPFYCVVPYEGYGPGSKPECREYVDFPDPEDKEEVFKDTDYYNWYFETFD